jgi:hypothetical protein
MMLKITKVKKAIEWGGVVVAGLWVVQGAIKATNAIAAESKRLVKRLWKSN